MSITLRAKRILTGALAGALVLGLLPAGVASANTDVCDGASSAGFADTNGTFQSDIDCAVGHGIMTGQAGNVFNASSNMTRGQMATALVNFVAAAQNVDVETFSTEGHTFEDIAGTTHEDNIARAFAMGIIKGRDATTFDPGSRITRAAAATMVANAHVSEDALNMDLSGVVPYTDFTDLGNSVHAPNINVLATAGVITGTNDAGTLFAPNRSVTRGQLAAMVIRAANVVVAPNGLWNAPALGEAATNQTFTVTGGDVTIVDPAAVSAADADLGQNTPALNITYTVTDAVVGADHSIELFDAANVTVDADGVATFVDNGAGLADTGVVAVATIVSINGDTDAAAGTQQVQGFRPNSQTFTFTVQVANDSANVLETIVPVVYFDEDGDTGGVEVDGDGVPEDDALFGVGGQIEVLPVELTTGGLANDADIVLVDTDRNILVIQPEGGALVHVAYAASDDFFVNPGGTAEKDEAAHASDLAGFEARVSVGDQLVGVQTVYSRTGTSELVLNDIVPGAVSGLAAAAVSDTAINLTEWDDANADSYTVYRAVGDDLENDGAGELVAADEAAFSEIGTVAGDDDREFSDTGLTADTTYVYWVTATIDGVESVFTTGALVGDTVAVDTLAEGEVAAVVSNIAVANIDTFPTGEVNEGDVIRIGFNQAVALVGWGIQVRDANGTTSIIDAVGLLNSEEVTFDGETYAANELLTVTIDDGDAAGLVYPLTITQTTGIAAANDATNGWNLGLSGDVTIEVDTTIANP